MKMKLYYFALSLLGLLSYTGVFAQTISEENAEESYVIRMITNRPEWAQISLIIEADGEFRVEGASNIYSDVYSDIQPEIRIYGKVTSLTAYTSGLTSLDISQCPMLKYLNCNNNELSSLYLGNSTSLETLLCSENQLTNINISKCPALSTLGCNNNQLTQLDLTNCSALTSLECYGNHITTLELSQCSSLQHLNASKNPLFNLEVSQCKDLEVLKCSDNQLVSLDVSQNVKLNHLSCENNRLTHLDLIKNEHIEELNCSNNKIATISLGYKPNLSKFDCYNNQIKIEEMRKLVNTLAAKGYYSYGAIYLKNYEVETEEGNELTDRLVAVIKAKGWNYWGNEGTSTPTPTITMTTNKPIGEVVSIEINAEEDFSVEGLKKIGEGYYRVERPVIQIAGKVVSLGCSDCGLISLDVSDAYLLQRLGCGGNDLTSLDVSENYALNALSCGFNQLETLVLGGNSVLQQVSCHNNKLAQIDISNNAALSSLDCSNNLLRSIEIGGHSNLASLTCNYNLLNHLHLPLHSRITKLSCSDNQLTDLILSQCTSLKELTCSNNPLEILDISECATLAHLTATHTPLRSLDISHNAALERLDCSNNQLDSIVLNDNFKLRYLACNNNQIKLPTMERLIESLSYTNGIIQVIDARAETAEGNEVTHELEASAKAKLWEVRAIERIKNGYQLNVNLDNIHILSVPETGCTTYFNDKYESKQWESGTIGYIFNNSVRLPEGLSAYKVVQEEGELRMEAMNTSYVNNRTAVIVKGAPGFYYIASTDERGTSLYEGNLLRGSDYDVTLSAEEGHKLYIFQEGSHGLGFYWQESTEGQTADLKKRDVYLQLPVGMNLEGFSLDGKLITEVHTPHSAMQSNNKLDVYDLSGRRVKHFTRGLYLMNGQKIMR